MEVPGLRVVSLLRVGIWMEAQRTSCLGSSVAVKVSVCAVWDPGCGLLFSGVVWKPRLTVVGRRGAD